MSGYDEADVRLYTDTSGNLHIVSKLDASDNLYVYGGTTGYSGTIYESTVGQNVEQIVFDDGTVSLTGALDADYLNGGDGNDTLHGQAGADYLYGDAGADIFAFEVASAFSAQETIADFNTSQGDAIDIHNLLVGFDPVTSAITDFVSLSTSSGNTIMSVDRDGTGGTYSAQAIATISGVTGLDVDDLLANGHLIAA